MLFPVSLDELMPEHRVCRVIDAFVGSLYLVQLGFSKAHPAATSRPSCDPADLLKPYLYGCLQQARSSPRLQGGEWLAIDGSKFEAIPSRERLLREQAALDRRVGNTSSGWMPWTLSKARQ